MALRTEIPAAADIERWQIGKWLPNEFTPWTIDRERESYLIFMRKAPALGGMPEREDYYFSHKGRAGVISTVLHLEHEGSNLVYHWHLVSSLGLAHQFQTDAHVLLMGTGGDTRHAGNLDKAAAAETLACLTEAFLNYKAWLGLRDGANQRVLLDSTALLGNAGLDS